MITDVTATRGRADIGVFSSQGAANRIAYVFGHSMFQGGGEFSFFELIKCIDKKKVNPLVFVPEKGEIADCLSGLGMEVSICPFPPLKTMGFGVPIWALLKFIKILRSADIKLIHANGSRVCLYSGIAGRLLNIPMIWHVRETIQDVAAYDNLLARLSSAIICVSNSVKIKRFEKFGHRIINKIHVAYNGVDTQRFTGNPSAGKKMRQKLDIGTCTLFGIVGNIIPLKGQDFFLRGLALARKNRPDLAVKAIFLGRFLDPEYKRLLDRLTVNLNLQGDVIFNGYSDDIATYLAAVDVFALPSQREGCSRAMLEAMSVGLPVIASKISEIQEAVNPGGNAILVNYGDVTQMAAAIIELSENKKLREFMGEANRKRAKAFFSMNSHVDSIQRIYENELIKTCKESNCSNCN